MDYRPHHLPECPARNPAVLVDDHCICPPERFAPGQQPIYEPGDGPEREVS